MRNSHCSILILLCAVLTTELILLAGCDDDNPTGPEGSASTPTPVSTCTISYQFMLEPREDGLYCSDDNDRKLMMPWPITVGQKFQTCIPDCGNLKDYWVFSVDGTYNVIAGSFDHVTAMGRSMGYLYECAFFKPETGFLGYESIGGRSYQDTELSSYQVACDGNPLAAIYGLAAGNRWEYSIQGMDSNGHLKTEGIRITSCLSKTGYAGSESYVILVNIHTKTYGLGATAPRKPILIPPVKSQKPATGPNRHHDRDLFSQSTP